MGGTLLLSLLARGTSFITGSTVTCDAFPTSSVLRNSTQAISLRDSHSQPTRPAGTTLGRGPLNSLLLYGTGPLSELGVHKNDLLFAILVKAQPGPSLSLPSPFLFPSLKGNEGFKLNQNGRGL